MSKKNVTVHIVDYTGVNSFVEILLNPSFNLPFQITQYKTTELKFVEPKANGTIIGLFVTTQKIGIPPAHKPGEDDYTAIPLDEGQGLAYPNTMLYDIQTNTMYLETNRVGLNEKRVSEYFMGLAEGLGMLDFSMSLAPVLKPEAYERVNNMVFVDSMECKIANPLQLIRSNVREGSLRSFRELANDLNATKTISVVVKSEEIEGGITKREVLRFINFFGRMITGASFDRKNKLVVKGRKVAAGLEEGELIEDDINFFVDKIKDSFILDEPNVASHLQPVERKRGITSVYERHCQEVTNILGNV
jgi:hypothetical protein